MPATEVRHSWSASAWRFLLAGGANTLVTAAALAALSLVIDARVAYTIVFSIGIMISTYLADRFVYGVRMPRVALLAYVAMYVVVYGVGLVVVDRLAATSLPDWTSSAVVVVTAPLTYLGGRIVTGFVYRHRAPATTTEES